MHPLRLLVDEARVMSCNRPWARWIWLCPALSVAVAAGVLMALGLSVWAAMLAALVLGCPIVALWAFFTGRRPRECALWQR